jgi:hypothetical protein
LYVQDFYNFIHKDLSGARQLKWHFITVEKLGAEFLLRFLDGFGQGWLGYMKLLGRLREIFGLGQRENISIPADIHAIRLLFYNDARQNNRSLWIDNNDSLDIVLNKQYILKHKTVIYMILISLLSFEKRACLLVLIITLDLLKVDTGERAR